MGVALSGIVNFGGGVSGAVRFDEASATVLYFGQAHAGANPASSVWQIQRITFTAPGTDDLIVEFADGNTAYDNVWDDRAALSYS